MTDSAASFNIPEILEEGVNNILYVDDEDSNLRVFDSVFSRYYNVFTSNNGKTAIKLLHQYEIHMIITDQKMPEMTGTDLLEATLEDFPDVIRIILTGFADIQAIIRAINKCSIYKYVTKPYENAEMRDIIDKGLEIYNMREKKYNGNAVISSAVTENQNGNANQNGQSTTSEIDDSFAEKVLLDVVPDKGYYELFLENAISYHHLKKGQYFFKDFYINSDEESVKLYNLNFGLKPTANSAMVYMHLKLKLREVLEKNDNNIDLLDLLHELEEFYYQIDTGYHLSNVNLFTYNWQSGQMEYLTKEKKIRLYQVSHQFEELEINLVKNTKEGYQLYAKNGLSNFMIYGWDYEIRDGGSDSDLMHNVNQIITNATNFPFDMQESQIIRGIESVSNSYKDFLLFGLHITE